MQPRSKIAWSALAALAVGVVGCSGGKTESPPVQEESGVAPATSSSPTDATLDGDLRLHGVHVHQDYYHQNFPPKRLAFYWDVVNTSSLAIGSVEWELRRIDIATPLATGTFSIIAKYNGGSGHDLSVIYNEPQVGTHEYLLTIDPHNHLHETDESNNAYLFKIDVPTDPGWHPVPANDLHYVSDQAHFHDLLPNAGQLDFHFIAESTFTTPISGLQWRVRCASAGIDQTMSVPGTIYPKGRFECSHGVTVPPGEYDFEMTLDPANRFAETNEGDNTRIFHVVAPPVTGG